MFSYPADIVAPQFGLEIYFYTPSLHTTTRITFSDAFDLFYFRMHFLFSSAGVQGRPDVTNTRTGTATLATLVFFCSLLINSISALMHWTIIKLPSADLFSNIGTIHFTDTWAGHKSSPLLPLKPSSFSSTRFFDCHSTDVSYPADWARLRTHQTTCNEFTYQRVRSHPAKWPTRTDSWPYKRRPERAHPDGSLRRGTVGIPDFHWTEFDAIRELHRRPFHRCESRSSPGVDFRWHYIRQRRRSSWKNRFDWLVLSGKPVLSNRPLWRPLQPLLEKISTHYNWFQLLPDWLNLTIHLAKTEDDRKIERQMLESTHHLSNWSYLTTRYREHCRRTAKSHCETLTRASLGSSVQLNYQALDANPQH